MSIREQAFDRIWRALVITTLAVVTAYVAVEFATNPTKRLIEGLLGVVFLALGIKASPIALLGFVTLTIPYPMQTSVGSTTSLLILAVGALSIANAHRYGPARPFVDRQLDLPLAGFLVMTVLSLWHLSDTPGAGELAWQRYIGLASSIILYYLIVGRVTTEDHLVRLTRIAMFGAFTVGLIGTLQTLFPGRAWLPPIFQFSQKMAELEEVTRGTYRSYASFPGISPFGEFAATSIILMYFLARRTRSMAERTMWVAGILMLLVAVAGSATRMAVLILVFGFSYILVFGHRVVPRWQILNLAFVFVALLTLSYAFISPLTGLLEERLLALSPEDSSTLSRWGVMQQAFEAIPDRPILGHGIVTPVGTFRGGVSMNIHCLYLTIPYMFGIPALIAFLWYSARLVLSSYRWLSDRRISQGLRELLLAFHVCAVMTLVYELTGEFITHAQSMHTVWFRFGMLAAAIEVCRRAARNSSNRPPETT